MSHFTVLVIGPDVETQMAPFDENIEVPEYVADTREQLIAKSRAEVERYSTTGLYAEYLADPTGYLVKAANNPRHCRYIADEFPAKLTWTDEQHYADAIQYCEPHELDADGGRLSTYNPKSKWDWWVIGGRWDGKLRTLGGRNVNECPAAELDLNSTTPTFAVLKDGEWYERGRMGWWAMVSDEKDEDAWDTEWRELLKNLPADTPLTLVDAHI